MTEPETSICGVTCSCGFHGEPLACGWREGHDGPHSWASLPTFVAGRKRIEPQTQRLLSMRQHAEQIVRTHPEIGGPVEIDCRYVEAVTPPFLATLWDAWPEAVFVECNEDVQQTVALVMERRAQ